MIHVRNETSRLNYPVRYPYPLFEMLNTQQRALVFTASAVTFAISSLCLKRLYDLFNGKVKAELKKMI